jgi:hypothetical protein
MNEPLTTFRKLLHPVGPLSFVTDHYGGAPLHISGKPSKVKQVCSWLDFANLMNMTALWSSGSLKLVLDGRSLSPEEYCSPTAGRDGPVVQRPRYDTVQDLLEQGATVVADLVETLSPGIRSAATAFEMGVGAHVTCNAYMSRNARKAFPSHFDTMDVFALQIEGRKIWRVYEGRFEGPLERPGYSYLYFDQPYHEQAKGALAFEVELQPGDLLYIPAGVYHDALASTDACLHLSFGVTRPTVFDYFSWMTRSLDDLQQFRAMLPDYVDESARDAMLAEAEVKLAEMLKCGAARAQFGDEMQRQAHRLLSPVSIPPSPADTRFRVAPSELQKRESEMVLLTGSGEHVPDSSLVPIIRWLQDRDLVTGAELSYRLRKLESSAANAEIELLIDFGLLVQLRS